MKRVLIAAVGVLIGAVCASPVWAADCEWTGNVSRFWSQASNWTACRGGVPQSPDGVIFPIGRPNASTENDIPGLVLSGMQFPGTPLNSTNYDISGQDIRLIGPISVTRPVSTSGQGVRIRNRLIAVQDVVFFNAHTLAGTLQLDRVVMGGFTLQLHANSNIQIGEVSGNGTLIKLGPAGLTLGANSYTGLTVIRQGTIYAQHSQALGDHAAENTIVESGATLYLGNQVVLRERLTLVAAAGTTTPALVTAEDGTATLNGDIVLNGQPIVSTPAGSNLAIAGAIQANASTTWTKLGPGAMTLARSGNTWGRLIVRGGSLLLSGPNALAPAGRLTLAESAVVNLGGHDQTTGGLDSVDGFEMRLLLTSATLTVNQLVQGLYGGTIEGSGHLVKTGPANLYVSGTAPNSFTGTTTIQQGSVSLAKPNGVPAVSGPIVVNGGELLSISPAQIPDNAPVTINSPGVWTLIVPETIGSLSGSGRIVFQRNAPSQVPGLIITQAVTGTFSGSMEGSSVEHVAKGGAGTLVLTGNNPFTPGIRIAAGTLVINGTHDAIASILVDAGRFTGSGRVGHITGSTGATVGLVSPTPGAAITGNTAVMGGTLEIQVADAGHGQLRLTGGLTLRAGARLAVVRLGVQPRKGTKLTIVSAGQAVNGFFAGLPQGGTIDVDGQRFQIDYFAGNGHDIALTALDGPSALTYFLAEGSTGGFFDEDVLLANPNTAEAPVTLTFLKDNGQQVVVSRTLAPQSQAVVHVDEIPGLEGAAASVRIDSTSGQELFVERTMFWDPAHYAGHTGSALRQPSQTWFFAEGAQGFFDTFVLVINPNPTPTDVTFTFLRERGAPVVRTVTVRAASRLTLGAHEVPEIASSAFGISVTATQPIMAERAMYFASTPGRLWGGGHASAGLTAPRQRWFLAEGASGGFFDTFILLSNPQDAPAQVTVKYLLWTGDAISVQKTVPAKGRLTINPETETDERLKNAAFSTDITSDVAIVAERSMYWPGATRPWGEAHNSVAFGQSALSWGLAEGRLGGDGTPFSTFILLANPEATNAQVEVTFLRAQGAPVVKTYTVPATGRFTIDASTIPELHDSTFGASIKVTNQVPIVVERSMYWDANGIFWSGGTNAPGVSWGIR